MRKTPPATPVHSPKAHLAALPVFALTLAASVLTGMSTSVSAQNTATCTVAGMNWNNDPVFRAALHPSDREQGIRQMACSVAATQDLVAGDVTLRLTMGTLFQGDASGPKLNPVLINIERRDGATGKQLARVFLGPDALDGQIHFEPQAVNLNGTILLRLSPRHNWLFKLDGDAVSAMSAFAWRDALDSAFPDDARSGQNLSIDLEKMVGRVAVRRIATDPAASYPSAYDAPRVLSARLAWQGGKLVATASEVTARKEGEEPFLDQFAAMDVTVRDGLKNLPKDVEACSLGAWSNDIDPKGLNVRAAPAANAPVLGIVPPPRKLPKEHEFSSDPVKAEFRIIGHREGWFLIENIKAPGVAYDAPYPRHLPQPFKGRGWVNGRMVGAAYANGGLPAGRLYLSPNADADYKTAADKDGNPVGADGSPARLLACSGWWGLIETKEQQRGWLRTLCSNQATNCS